MNVRVFLLLLLIPILEVSASNRLIEGLDSHNGLVAVVYEEDGLRWLELFKGPKKIWTSGKARYIEFNWSSRGDLAVRLCNGPCYNLNEQRVQVFSPSTMVSWNSSVGRLARFRWSPKGKIAVVIWRSPCGDYSEHWVEVYDSLTHEARRSVKKGYLFVSWSPSGNYLAATVKGDQGYYVELLDEGLNTLWSSQEAVVADFKWSKNDWLAVRLSSDGVQWLEAYINGYEWRSENATRMEYDWDEGGELVYSVNDVVKVERFSIDILPKFITLAIVLIIIVALSVRLSGRSVQTEK